MQFRLSDPEPLLFHNEAIVRDGKIVGTITSGNYGHHLGGAVGLGYVPCPGESEADVLGSSYEIEIAGERFAAEASLKPMYDPKAERVQDVGSRRRDPCHLAPPDPQNPATFRLTFARNAARFSGVDVSIR